MVIIFQWISTRIKDVILILIVSFGTLLPMPLCYGQTAPACAVAIDESGNQRPNGSQLCVRLKFTKGRPDFDQTQSRFSPSEEFKRRLNVPLVQAEASLFSQLSKLFMSLQKPYRLALSDEERQLDDQDKLNDTLTAEVRNATKGWLEFLSVFNAWADAGQNRRHFEEIFAEEEATSPPNGIIVPLTNAQDTTASLIYENGYAPDEGMMRFFVADPINNWGDSSQVEIKLPGVSESGKRETRLKRIREILEPLRGTPRCLDCITSRVNAFYKRLGLTPNLIFDNKGTSPLIINVIESARIVGISWLSLEENDENVDKVLYSLLTHDAFRDFYKHRAGIRTEKHFNYLQRTGHAGPYLNETRLQIQQLLVNQLGYTVSFAFAPNRDAPQTSNYNLTIQKISDIENAADDKPSTSETSNETPEPAPATANAEGVVTGHEQEKDNATEFEPETKTPPKKEKKRYVGGGLDFRPGQGIRFFGLGQVSRFPLLPDSVNSFSAKAGGQGTNGGIGAINYFGDYVFFNKLRRRVSLQVTISSDLDANRDLNGPLVDERRRSGLARAEFEPFRDWSGSLLRFFAEGRRETVALQPTLLPETKQNLTTLEVGALYLFESTEVENPRRIRLEPGIRMGFNLPGESRFNKWLTTGNIHQLLPGRFEIDISGRIELASHATPVFELPTLGGADVLRGFRHDDGLGRKLWSLQNELWVPLPIGDETSQGIKAMLREKVKLAPFVDVGGLYKAVNTTSGVRKGTGLGLRLIYNPIIFKIDYAYGFGPAATVGSRGKFYFSVGSNLPF
jgi:Omp85 superfamily domain